MLCSYKTHKHATYKIRTSLYSPILPYCDQLFNIDLRHKYVKHVTYVKSIKDCKPLECSPKRKQCPSIQLSEREGDRERVGAAQRSERPPMNYLSLQAGY